MKFGKQFVHFVFLWTHVSAVSLPLSPAVLLAHLALSVMSELLLVLHYALLPALVLANNLI